MINMQVSDIRNQHERTQAYVGFGWKITIPIHWVVPSIIKASTTLVMDGFTDWIQTWSKQKHHCKSQIMINGFDSIEDECQQVVLHAKTLMGKVALVVPNDQIKDQLVIATKTSKIFHSRANSVLLKNTLVEAY